MPASFAERPPSEAWERIPLPDSTGNSVWVWFKPPSVPQGLVVRIPEETFRDYPHQQLTIRKLLQAAEIEPCCVSLWSLYGVAYEGQQGRSPFLDLAIPEPATGAEPNIVVCLSARPESARNHESAPVAVEQEDLSKLFQRFDADWNAILQMEGQLVILRKHLVDMLTRINGLNRDLTPDERLYGDRQDKSDWQEARRWLRDVAARLSHCLKQNDIGVTSAAGKRNWFEQTYLQFIVPRQQFDGIQQVERKFASHRKILHSLQISMNTALTKSAQDGERRAQQVLNRLAAKVRSARSKR